MGLKVLHSGDLHLDSPFSGFPEDQRQLLLASQRKLPEELTRLCGEQKADMVLLAGDVFDGPYQKKTAALLADCLEDCGVPVLITPGNHDYDGLDSPWQRELWPDNVHIFRGNLSYVDLENLDCRVYGGGFRSMDCPGFESPAGHQKSASTTWGLPIFTCSLFTIHSSLMPSNPRRAYRHSGHVPKKPETCRGIFYEVDVLQNGTVDKRARMGYSKSTKGCYQ